jgi:hypothetical protein
VNDITVNAGDAGVAVNFGSLSGTNTLTVVASNANGDVSFASGNIGSLSVTDANDVSFAGAFTTTGSLSAAGVDGEIDVAAASTVSGGGAVTFNSTGSLDLNGAVSGLSVSLTGATNLSGTVSGQNNVGFNSALVVDGNASASSQNGNVTFSSTVDSNAADTNTFEVTALNGTTDFQNTVGAGNTLNGLTVRSSRTEFDNTVAVGSNGLLVEGFGGTTVLANNVTSGGDVIINDSVLLAGNVTIDTTANNSLIKILGTVDGANNLVATAGTGTGSANNSGSSGRNPRLSESDVHQDASRAMPLTSWK